MFCSGIRKKTAAAVAVDGVEDIIRMSKAVLIYLKRTKKHYSVVYCTNCCH